MKNSYIRAKVGRDRKPVLTSACSSQGNRRTDFDVAQAMPTSGRKDYVASFHTIFGGMISILLRIYTKNREV